MNRREKINKIAGAVFILMVLVVGLSFFVDGPFEVLKQYLGENKILTGLSLFVLIFLATVLAPLTAFPIVPMAATFIGPFASAVISVLSWTLGAVVAFLIARYWGRPVLARLVDMKEIDRFGKYIPEGNEFVLLVLLRMLIPVDVLSYAVGLLSKIRLRTYALATLIGVTPFTFLFAYGGEAFLEQNYRTFIILGIFSLVVFILTFLVYREKIKK